MEAPSGCGALSISGVIGKLIFNETNSYLLVASCCWSTTAFCVKWSCHREREMVVAMDSITELGACTPRYRCSRQNFSFM